MISHFNRKGQGGEEYARIRHILYDEKRQELFLDGITQMQVYGLDGTYKRSFSLTDSLQMDVIESLDENAMVFLDMKGALFVKEGETAKIDDNPEASNQPYVLMDKETGKPVVIHGKEVTAEATFKPAVSTGTKDIFFTFDARTLKGKDVVVFETLYKVVTDKDGKVTEEKVTIHEDITDERQTVKFPEIHTTATGENGEKTIEAKGIVNIIDTVRYEHLIAGKSYTMKGYLVDKKTGKAIYENGEKVTSEVIFIAEDTSGTVEMVFTVNAKALSGKKIVVFEDCYYEDVKVAAHADINDEGQLSLIHISEPTRH